ncbi:AMIN domain-containing protein [bacterium]|nr:AMIN domain-containing protein [bacterium]
MMRSFSVLAVLLLAHIGTAVADPAGRVLSIRFGESGSQTRIVIDSDRPLPYDVFGMDNDAASVVLDLPRVRWSINGLTTEAGSGEGAGLVSGYRFSNVSPQTSRLTLKLETPAKVARNFALPPNSGAANHRIVLDLERVDTAAFKAQARTAPPPETGPRQRTSRKPMIVIDPGHGGKDPGAIAPTGVFERDVTLASALELQKELLASGRYDVELTRTTDVFLELEERVARARSVGADLFISLHADAGADPSVRGASVYTLSAKAEKRAETVRQRNDWLLSVEADTSRSPQVNQILADLVQRETKNQSARFAQSLIPAIAATGWPALRNTHRNAGFFVLLAPDVPAVLLEMGFLTNREDARLLTTKSERKKLISAVASAIDGFFYSEIQLYAAR